MKSYAIIIENIELIKIIVNTNIRCKVGEVCRTLECK